MEPVFLDWETEGIDSLPSYPPEPVGLAVLDRAGQFKSQYLAFGHPTENNSTRDDVQQLLHRIWDSGREVCFHNAAFDMAVCVYKMGMSWLPANRVHDTLFLAFLKEPFANSLSLKSFCQEHLGIKPEERDTLFEWLIAHVEEAAKKPKQAGAWICKAPGKLVGEYAEADVRLTAALYDYCEDVRLDQQEAYLRERRLMPILVRNSMAGVRVDRTGLQTASAKALDDIARCEAWLNKYLGSSAPENYNSGRQLVKAVFEVKANNPDKPWPLSDKGTPLSDKDTLAELIVDPMLSSVLRHREALSKINGTYLEPFIEQSTRTGRIYTQWNQVRGEAGGTRTGRLSARPTLQTLVSRFPKTPLPPEIGVLTFPKVRQYLLPDDGDVMVAADFQAQELRLFAHFEGGKLAEQYRLNPNADLHTFAAELMSNAAGRPVIRDHAKTMSFGILYGAGPKKISEMLGIHYNDAKELIDLYKTQVAQGLNDVNADLNYRYNRRQPFRTVGGRLLRGEQPKLIGNRVMNFGFKSLNLLIQGSGADFTKQAMVDYGEQCQGSRLLMSLHDELVISCKPEYVERESKLLTDCMVNAFKLDVPMVAEAKVGTNFSEVK